MNAKIDSDQVYCQSADVVSREIEGTIVIIPIVAGIGDMENELFSLNDSGKTIWQMLDGKLSVNKIISELEKRFDAAEGDIREDVIGLLTELLKRKMIVQKSQG
ncbi:MAG TPA: pyrroloquinoline quinone biosynthesis peptide chaperone PqqD [bacterium]|nr:pyrroloquinoline quinone biosynthesis peptide chaperone PqqD [bacterium]